MTSASLRPVSPRAFSDDFAYSFPTHDVLVKAVAGERFSGEVHLARTIALPPVLGTNPPGTKARYQNRPIADPFEPLRNRLVRHQHYLSGLTNLKGIKTASRYKNMLGMDQKVQPIEFIGRSLSHSRSGRHRIDADRKPSVR